MSQPCAELNAEHTQKRWVDTNTHKSLMFKKMSYPSMGVPLRQPFLEVSKGPQNASKKKEAPFRGGRRNRTTKNQGSAASLFVFVHRPCPDPSLSPRLIAERPRSAKPARQPTAQAPSPTCRFGLPGTTRWEGFHCSSFRLRFMSQHINQYQKKGNP